MDALTIFLILIIGILIVVIFFLFKHSKNLSEQLSELIFSKQSQSVKYGKMTEQWIPFSTEFPFDPQDFRFLGSPIDGVAFDPEGITFVEFKTASSSLSEKQKRIKELILNKKVDWLEFKLK